jgi:hypothetical protein
MYFLKNRKIKRLTIYQRIRIFPQAELFSSRHR